MKPPSLQYDLQKRLPFDSPEQEVFLNLARTQSQLAAPFERLFRAHDLSLSSYNILRILRGKGDAGCLCHEISEMTVTRVPDITRLLDRLEAQGLAQRARSLQDRRAVHVSVTSKGLDLLASLDTPLLDLHGAQLSHMDASDLAILNQLLVKLRSNPLAGEANFPSTPRV